jgi:hypothetical protein
MHFLLISKTPRVAAAHLDMMSSAIMSLINDRFAPSWGLSPITAARGDAPKAETVPCLFIDADGSDQATLGWHDDIGGTPIIVDVAGAVFAAGGDVIDDKGTGISVAAAFSHEVMETLVDPRASDWVQMSDGRFLAKEACDPVQAPLLSVPTSAGHVLMSNGTLPAYFDPQAGRGPYDLLGVVRSAFALQPEGYQIVFDPARLDAPDGPVTNLWGALVRPEMRAFKSRKESRSARRTSELARRLALGARRTGPGRRSSAESAAT